MNPVLSAINAYPLPILDLRNRAIFIENLLFIHAVIIASEPLIEDVLKREMDAPLRAFYEAHLEDERGHAEWLARDMHTLGVTPRVVDWRAAQIVGPQYYLVRHGPPQALLGYMAALECRPMPLEAVVELERIHGVKAMRTLRYHAENDANHGPALLRMIDAAGESKIVAYNAGLTASMLQWGLSQDKPQEAMNG